MTFKEIATARLTSQQVAGKQLLTVKDLVGWMGAMQAQDYAMAKWAIGLRVPNATNELVEAAINKGEILRTHILRPTWHFVAAKDIYWMQEFTAPHVRKLMKFRDKELGITEAIYKKTNKLIGKALSDNTHLTREALMAELEKAKINTKEYRSGHFMARAELDGIVCSGEIKDRQQTYALLSERVPPTKPISREAALKKLAIIYFTSHCPATLSDFVWWSGLSVKDGNHAIEMIKKDFTRETINKQEYWISNSFAFPAKIVPSLHLLPAFDEFLISYKNRTAALRTTHQPAVFSSNGIFRPVIVRNGEVIGLWKRSFKKEQVTVEINLFEPANATIKKQIATSAKSFATFLGNHFQLIVAY